MTKAEAYLDRLYNEWQVWQKKQDALPGDTISTDNPIYRMTVGAANRYYTAKYMMKLMKEEIGG